MLAILYRRELTSSARNIKTPAAILVNNGILVLVTIFYYYLEFESRGKLGQTVRGTAILNIYTLLCIIEFGIVLVSMLLLTVPSVIHERKNNSFDLVLAAGVSPIKFLMAKLLAPITIVMTIVCSSCPILGIVFYIGGVSLKNMLVMILGLFVVAFYFGAIGIFCSSFCKRNVTATVLAYTISFLVVVGTLMIVSGLYLVKKVSIGLDVSDSVSVVCVGKLSYLLLLNPFYNFLRLLHEQLGVMNEFSHYINIYEGSSIFSEQWAIHSGLVQVLLSMLLIWCSAQHLKDKKRNKKTIFR